MPKLTDHVKFTSELVEPSGSGESARRLRLTRSISGSFGPERSVELALQFNVVDDQTKTTKTLSQVH